MDQLALLAPQVQTEQLARLALLALPALRVRVAHKESAGSPVLLVYRAPLAQAAQLALLDQRDLLVLSARLALPALLAHPVRRALVYRDQQALRV